MVAVSLDRYVRGDLVLFAEPHVVFTEIAVIRREVGNGSELLREVLQVGQGRFQFLFVVRSLTDMGGNDQQSFRIHTGLGVVCLLEATAGCRHDA